MKFSIEEIVAAGGNEKTFPFGIGQCWEASEPSAAIAKAREVALTLAVNHRERASEALGKGWEVRGTKGRESVSWWSDCRTWALTADADGVYFLALRGTSRIPAQQLAGALIRGAKISATRKAMEGAP